MPSQSFAATIFASSHPNIEKRLSMQVIIVSTALFIAGVALLVIFSKDGRGYSPLNISLMAAGALLSLYAIRKGFSHSMEIVYTPTGSKTEEHSLFFDLKYMDELKNCTLSGDFRAISEVKSEKSGNLRMDVILSQDRKFAAVQLLQFIPYAYQPVTPVKYFTNEEASDLFTFLSGCKK